MIYKQLLANGRPGRENQRTDLATLSSASITRLPRLWGLRAIANGMFATRRKRQHQGLARLVNRLIQQFQAAGPNCGGKFLEFLSMDVPGGTLHLRLGVLKLLSRDTHEPLTKRQKLMAPRQPLTRRQLLARSEEHTSELQSH